MLDKGFENHKSIETDVSDYEDTPFYHLLLKLPKELAKNHLIYIESQNFSDEEAMSYFHDLIESRNEVMRNSVISDDSFAELVSDDEAALFENLEHWTRHNPDNYLGGGTTAQVKLFRQERADSEAIELAIKYILTPNEKTLTARDEHDVIAEVERIRKIEQEESKFKNRSRFIRVPHPYLHHTTPDLQLYGMERIKGFNLYELTQGSLSPEFTKKIMDSELMSLDSNELKGYIERFFDTMHEYCLHGDIKPRNIMLSEEGVFYIIDFGQSRLAHTVPEEADEQFENLKADEIKLSQTLCLQAINKLKQQLA